MWLADAAARLGAKTHGCTNMLAWLRAMDPDAFGTLMTSHVEPESE